MDQSNWANFLVEIRANLGAGEAKVGTGFLVAENIVLTARHALIAGDGFANRILVRWPKLSRDWVEATVDWPEPGLAAGEPDAALLRCRPPEEVRRFANVLNERPATGRRWDSSGFADAGAYCDENREATPLGGELVAAPDPLILLHTRIAVTNDEYWKGVSGSPVFVDGTWNIIGVIATCPPNLRGEVLTATPTWMLLQDPAFSALVKPDQTQDRWKKLDDLERKALGKLKSAKNSVRDALLAECGIVLCPQENSQQALERTLRTMDAKDAVEKLRCAHKSLRENGDAEGAKLICEIACLMIPTKFDVVDVDQILSTSDAIAVTLQISNHTVAEFVMARLDGRNAAFRPPRSPDRWAWGRNHINLGPEPGLFEAPQHFCDIWKEATVKEFLSEPEVQDLRKRGDNVYDRASYRIKILCRDQGAKYYVIDVPGYDYDKSEWPEVVRSLKGQFPSVVFLRLERSLEVMDRDDEMFLNFVSVLASEEPVS